MMGGVPIAAFDGAIAGAEAARSARRRGLPARVPNQVGAEEDRLGALLSERAQAPDGRGIAPIRVKNRIREIVSNHMMFEKTEKGLNDAIDMLSRVEDELVPNMRLRSVSTRYNTDLVDALDVQDMLDVCRITAHACLTRQESRGPHFREEFPFTDNDNWLKHIVVSSEKGQVKTRFEPVRQKYLRPKPGRLDYFGDPYA
jgi:succinate dehydrogenase/fumarate reductase flavoprotein subunit